MGKKSGKYAAKLCLIVIAAALLAWGSTSKSPAAAPATPPTTHVAAKPAPKPYTFPDGSRTLFPNYRMVALYGTPNMPVLGALGEQNLPQSIARVRGLAAAYQPYSAQHILPTMEIITTIASATPTENGDYSRETDVSGLLPWVLAAKSAGVYIVLDLQPGRSSFPTQAKEYAPLLEQPNVGLALDPEWRLAPDQVPLVQVGSVNIHEVNATAGYLAALTTQYKLPQKLFLLHEFRLTMLPDRSQLDTSHTQLAYAIQMDGQGTQAEKAATWQAVTADPPANEHFGWKNFYKKDSPILSPAQTMQLSPQPWYISYQ